MNSMNNSEGLSDKYKGRLFAGYMVAGILYQFGTCQLTQF